MTVSRIKVRLPTKFPSSVSVSDPLTLDRTGGAFAFGVDMGALVASINPDDILAGTQTGTGALVRATSPALINPTLGVATATSYNKVTITPPANNATLTLIDGTVLTGPAASGTVMTLGNAETVTGAKSFNDSTVLLKGSSSGVGTLKAPAAASTFAWTLPAATTTLAGYTDNLSVFASTSSSQLKAVMSDETGAGPLVFGNSPTLLTPNTVGTTTNNDAAAGSVGEVLSSTIASGSAVALTTGTPANLTSVALTAGDWDVSVSFAFLPAASTSITALIGNISQTSATRDTAVGAENASRMAAVVPGANASHQVVGPYRISLAGPATIYAVAQATFTVSTMGVYGILRARRIR